MAAFPVGTRVRVRHDVWRYPHFIAPAGAEGVVVDVGDSQVLLAVRLDEPVPGAEEWGNEVHWLEGDEPFRDLEVIRDELDAVGAFDDGDPGYVAWRSNIDRVMAEADKPVKHPLRESDYRLLYLHRDGPAKPVYVAWYLITGRALGLVDEALDIEGVEAAAAQERAYELASADVVVGFTSDEALWLVDILELYADIREGQGDDDARNDYEGALGLAAKVRQEVETSS